MKTLKAKQLAHYVGVSCFVNNGNEVIKSEINFLMLNQYDKGTCIQIVPILRPLKEITSEEIIEIRTEPFFVDGFSLSWHNRLTDDLFNFHRFVAEWDAFDCYQWFIERGFDVYGWLNDKHAISKEKADQLNDKYSPEAFADILRMI